MQSLISEQIISGNFPPGMRLDERQLAEKFEVSRTPVREALRQLAARGLTQILPMRGVVVMQIGVKELSEILHADCELEALCARLAAESMTTMEKTELVYIHQRAKEFVGNEDLDGYLEANREFHRLILEGSHNKVLAQMVGDIRERLSPYRQYHPAENDRLVTSHASHDAIVDAIVGGHGEAAYLAMRAHNAHLGNAALRALRQASEAGASSAADPAHEAASQPRREKTAVAAAKKPKAPGGGRATATTKPRKKPVLHNRSGTAAKAVSRSPTPAGCFVLALFFDCQRHDAPPLGPPFSSCLLAFRPRSRPLAWGYLRGFLSSFPSLWLERTPRTSLVYQMLLLMYYSVVPIVSRKGFSTWKS
ncbi:GntR family transcriptional regulator [Variovorax sp. E3]|uniref:GntR family transcriptional regulator n=1 Tax=Variovorax sp. E3 TaxID=1914993 RepID=UPI0018DD92AB|nr:GntR family transcriptional regulator [Variovorax sp. E3]